MAAQWPQRARDSGKAVAALLLLCLLWSLDSLWFDLFPHPAASSVPAQATTLQSEAVSFLLLAIVAGLFARLCAAEWPRGRKLWASAAIGLGLFVAPAVLVSLSSAWVSATTRVAIFSLVPAFAVVLEPHLGGDRRPPGMSGLAGALAAVAGTLFIFPSRPPASLGAGTAIASLILAAACVAAANCGAVRLARACQTSTIAPIAAIAGAAAAAGLAFASALAERAACRWDALLPELGHATVQLPGLLLLFWLMRRMSAARMTTRFVLAPLTDVYLLRASISGV